MSSSELNDRLLNTVLSQSQNLTTVDMNDRASSSFKDTGSGFEPNFSGNKFKNLTQSKDPSPLGSNRFEYNRPVDFGIVDHGSFGQPSPKYSRPTEFGQATDKSPTNSQPLLRSRLLGNDEQRFGNNLETKKSGYLGYQEIQPQNPIIRRDDSAKSLVKSTDRSPRSREPLEQRVIEPRVEPKFEIPKYESKIEAKPEPRFESKFFEWKAEQKSDSSSRPESRIDSKYDPKLNFKYDAPKFESKYEHQMESKIEPKYDWRAETKFQVPKYEPKQDPKYDPVPKHSEPTQIPVLPENIDINKIKKSKLYQKFLKDNEKQTDSSMNKTLGSREIQPTEKRGRSQSPHLQGYFPSIIPNEPTFRRQSPPQKNIQESHKNQYMHEDNKNKLNESLSDSNIIISHSNQLASPNRNHNESFAKSDHGGSTVNLNLNASSKFVVPATANPNYAYRGNAPQNELLVAQGYPPYVNFNFDSNPAPKQEYNEAQDAFLLRSKVQELTQSLNREIESRRMAESKCHEYMHQLEKASQTLEETKKKLFEGNTNHQEEMTSLQDRVRHLSERLSDKERSEDELKEEVNSLKRKLNSELNSRGRFLDENDDLQRRIDELIRQKKDREDDLNGKDEENQRLRKQLDSERNEINYLKNLEEKITHNLKEANFINNDLTSKNAELIKILEERDQAINMMTIENDSLKNLTGTLRSQYRDLLSENEGLKKDIFSYKERCLQIENDYRTADMALEKFKIELKQLREALSRTEEALQRERRSKADIIIQSGNLNHSLLESANVPPELPKRDLNPPELPKREWLPIESNQRRVNAYHEEPRSDHRVVPSAREQMVEMKRDRSLESRDFAPKATKLEKKSYEQYQANYNRIPDDFESLRKDIAHTSNQRNDQSSSMQLDLRRAFDNQAKEDKALDYASKYERQQPPKQYKNASSIVFADPGVQTPPKKNQNRISEQPKAQPQQNQNYRPTRGLLDWDEPPEMDAQTKAKRKEEFRQSSPSKYAPFSNDLNEEADRHKAKAPPKIDGFVTRENQGREDVSNKSEQVKSIEKELMNLQMQRDNLNNELQRIDKIKIKSGANIRKRQEIEFELSNVQATISNSKTKLRELNVLHPYQQPHTVSLQLY